MQAHIQLVYNMQPTASLNKYLALTGLEDLKMDSPCGKEGSH